VGAHDGQTHTGNADTDSRGVEDLLGLVDHLHLFFVVAILQDRRVMAEEVHSQLIGEDLSLDLLALAPLLGCALELVHGRLPRTAGCLVGRDDNPLERVLLVKGPYRNRHNDG